MFGKIIFFILLLFIYSFVAFLAVALACYNFPSLQGFAFNHIILLNALGTALFLALCLIGVKRFFYPEKEKRFIFVYFLIPLFLFICVYYFFAPTFAEPNFAKAEGFLLPFIFLSKLVSSVVNIFAGFMLALLLVPSFALLFYLLAKGGLHFWKKKKAFGALYLLFTLLLFTCSAFVFDRLCYNVNNLNWLEQTPKSYRGLYPKNFLILVQKGTYQQIEKAINDGISVNTEVRKDTCYNLFSCKEPVMTLSALTSAIKRGNPDILNLLIRKGANLNAKVDSETSVLNFAVLEKADIQIINILIKNGAKMD